MSFFIEGIVGLGILLRALVDALLGRRRKCYHSSVVIEAPRDVVWSVTSAREIEFDGFVPIAIRVAPHADSPAMFEGTVEVGSRRLPIAYREISTMAGQGALVQVLASGGDPEITPETQYFVAYTLADDKRGTRLAFRHELTHGRFRERLTVPIGARQNARRIKRHCERLAGRPAPSFAQRAWPAIMTGLLTYLSFHYLFGGQSAAILLALIAIHEVGHVVAMRLVGQPVQGIYFIPFLGGVAVAAAPHRSEAERGFVALMGPGLSLVTTAAFVLLWQITRDQTFAELAIMSAILNGLNLVPVLPLDGGQVVDALLSRADPEVSHLLNFTALLAGVGVSVYYEWQILTACLLLTAPIILMRRNVKRSSPAISVRAQMWLATAYVGTIAFYVAALATVMR